MKIQTSIKHFREQTICNLYENENIFDCFIICFCMCLHRNFSDHEIGKKNS